MGQRQEGKGGREIPRSLRKEIRKLAEAMRASGWTFEERKGHTVTAYAPRWIAGGIVTVGLPKTPSDVRGFRNARSQYRRWCDENGVERNI